jgi:hypothetical protein
VSNAFRGKNALDRHNIKCSVERTPKNNITKSCSYSLFAIGEVEQIKTILKRNNVNVLGIVPYSQ